MKNTIVISGFPGIVKRYLFNNGKNMLVIDSDSSNFSWLEPGVRDPEFPHNYMKHIKKNIGKYDIILVSSHKVVRDALRENNIPYTIYYPSMESKDIYINRYTERGNPESFIELVKENWGLWISEIENETYPEKVKLEDGAFLSDYI